MKFTSLLKKTAIAATLAGAFGAASANDYMLGTIFPGIPKSLVAFGGGQSLDSFSDTFNFTFAAGTASSGYSVEAFDFDLFSFNFKTIFTNISLYSTNGTGSAMVSNSDDVLIGQMSSLAGSKSLSFGNVVTGAGTYYLKVSGKIDGGGNAYFYNGSISSSTIAPAVPEPETYAMLLAGLGVMGFIARRRNKAAA